LEEQGYAEMMRRADRELATGRIVVVDACFPRNAHRLRAGSIARGPGAAFRRCAATGGITGVGGQTLELSQCGLAPRFSCP